MKKTIKLKIKGIKGEKGDTPSTDELVSIITPLIPEPIKGDIGERGEKGDGGADGKDGADGYTPIKGIDYFDGAKGERGLRGFKGEDGKDVDENVINDIQAKVNRALDISSRDYDLSELKDVSPNIANATNGQVLKKNSTTGLWEAGNDTGSTSFITLTDTPSTYSGQAGKYPVVNGTETGLEFADVATSTPSLQEVTDVGATTTNAITALDFTSSNQTASRIASFDASKKIISLDTTTYPSLTELSYVKGVTSAIQTQLNAKQATLVSGTNIKTINGSSILGSGDLSITGTMAIGGAITSATAGSVLFAGTSGVLQQDNANFFWNDTNNILGVGTNSPSTSYRVDIKSTSTSLGGLRVYGGGPTGGAAQIGSGEIRLGNGATDFGNIAYNNQNGNVYIDNGYSGGSIFLRVGGVTLLGTTSTSAYASAVNLSSTGLLVVGGAVQENHLQSGEIRLGSNASEYALITYGASSGDIYFKDVYASGKYRFYTGSTQHMTLFGSTGDLSIGTTNDYARLALIKTTEQLRVGYDASNYYSTTVGSTGIVTFNAVGSGSAFTFSDPVTINGLLTLSAQNIATDTTTGMKIGTGTTQKLGFWNTTPDVQPTTAITASAFVANTSLIFDDSATYGGYTMGQVVASLKRAGLLA